MRKQTFLGFLKYYLKDLTNSSVLSIHKLVNQSKTNYRLIDPLIIYCAFTSKQEILNKYTNDEYSKVLESLNENNFLSEKYKDYSFSKIYNSYKNKQNVPENDNALKEKIRKKTISLMKENKITNYRVYTDLKLNHGNVNDYLTNGNCKKVSLGLSKRIYTFVKNFGK